jgi:ABC-type branched-subunit amino acid transport system substrate-binding protein
LQPNHPKSNRLLACSFEEKAMSRARAPFLLSAAALSAALALALAGCGKKEEAPKPAATAAAPGVIVVKIGHAAPLTGGIAHLGKDNENGVRLAKHAPRGASICRRKKTGPKAGLRDRTGSLT